MNQLKNLIKANNYEEFIGTFNETNMGNINKLLIKAAQFGKLDIIQYLVEKGADIHADNDSALYWDSEKWPFISSSVFGKKRSRYSC